MEPSGEAVNSIEGIRCPVCEGNSSYSEPAPGWGEWRRCKDCELEFVNPFRLPAAAEGLFEDAYQGRNDECEMRDFNRNLERRNALINTPELSFWTPAYKSILSWLTQSLEPGATVFEIGCGPGFFLHALRTAGFDAVGLDVAEVVVNLNRDDGYRVWHGSLATMPSAWVRPDAVVATFMLHHLDDPMGFLSDIKARWPWALLALAQYGPGRKGTLRAAPPRNLTRWNSSSLAAALVRTGYSPSVADIASSGVERRSLGRLRTLLRPMISMPMLFRLSKRIERQLLPKVLNHFGKDAEVVLAFAEPDRASSFPQSEATTAVAQ